MGLKATTFSSEESDGEDATQTLQDVSTNDNDNDNDNANDEEQ